MCLVANGGDGGEAVVSKAMVNGFRDFSLVMRLWGGSEMLWARAFTFAC
jgi:hypothetical protein